MPPVAPPAKPVEVVKPARKKRLTAPENESKADKFKRLANHRVPVAIKRLNQIASLANRAQYEWTADQAELITSTLRKYVDGVVKRFAGVAQVDDGFKL